MIRCWRAGAPAGETEHVLINASETPRALHKHDSQSKCTSASLSYTATVMCFAVSTTTFCDYSNFFLDL